MALKSASDGTERKRIEWLPENKLLCLRRRSRSLEPTPTQLASLPSAPPLIERVYYTAGCWWALNGPASVLPVLASNKAQQNRTEQNRQKLKNRKNIQEQTKPYLQNKQLILACGSRARQRLPADGQKCDMESQVGHIAINRPDKAHQSLIYYARAHTHARSAKMTKNMAVLRSLRSTSARQRSDLLLGHNSPPTAL